MEKFKLYIKPVIFIASGLILMFLFRNEYKDFFFPKKEVKDFVVEFTSNYKSNDDDLLININENIDSYIIIKINKDISNFIVSDNNNEVKSIDVITSPKTIALMINHNEYSSTIDFKMENKKYVITPKKLSNTISFDVDEKKE